MDNPDTIQHHGNNKNTVNSRSKGNITQKTVQIQHKKMTRIVRKTKVKRQCNTKDSRDTIQHYANTFR